MWRNYNLYCLLLETIQFAKRTGANEIWLKSFPNFANCVTREKPDMLHVRMHVIVNKLHLGIYSKSLLESMHCSQQQFHMISILQSLSFDKSTSLMF